MLYDLFFNIEVRNVDRMRIISENIRTLQQRKGLSQERLALLARINTSYLGQIERFEKTNPTIQLLDKIACALGLSSHESLIKEIELGGGQQDDIKQAENSLTEKLKALKQLRDEGIITEKEFEQTKKQILMKF